MASSGSAQAGGMDLGGGHGIACFERPEDARQVREAKGFIPDESLGRISSLEPLDLAESRQRTPHLYQARSEDFEEDLENILNNVDETLPDLGERLRSVELQISMSQTGTELMAFYRERIALPETCAYVQLAYQKMRTAEVVIDERLFFHEKMSGLGRAVLLLHEMILHLDNPIDEDSGLRTSEAVSLLLRRDHAFSRSQTRSRLAELGFLPPAAETEAAE